MTITAEQAAKLLEGTTPGPWNVQDFTGIEINSDPTAMDVTVSCAWPDHIAVAVMGGGYIGQQGLVQARTDACLIAAAPALARALIASDAARKLAEERLAKAVEALAWYGEQARLARLIHAEGDVGRHTLSNDGGQRARAILKEIDNG